MEKGKIFVFLWYDVIRLSSHPEDTGDPGCTTVVSVILLFSWWFALGNTVSPLGASDGKCSDIKIHWIL